MTIMLARCFAARMKSCPVGRILRVVQESNDGGKARFLQADPVDRNSGIDIRLASMVLSPSKCCDASWRAIPKVSANPRISSVPGTT